MKLKDYILTVGIFLLGLIPLTGGAQDGATLFKPCAACHTIGGGKTIGPDLKDVTKRRTNDWLVKFIQSSTAMVKAGDPDAVAVYKQFNNIPMPDYALSAEQINQILKHIEAGSGGTKADPAKALLQHQADSILKLNSPFDIQTGKELFAGEQRFENGGAACVSCHNVTYNNVGKGGTLAKDLTKAFSRLGGFTGIKGIISAAPFPSMLATYETHPVTEIENARLQLFLKSADEQNVSEPKAEQAWFMYAAIVAALFILAVISGLWSQRKRWSVNHSILKRQERYSN